MQSRFVNFFLLRRAVSRALLEMELRIKLWKLRGLCWIRYPTMSLHRAYIRGPKQASS